MIVVTGRTWQNQALLRELGGWFNRVEKRYEFDNLSSAEINLLRNTVGLIVSTPPEPDPIPTEPITIGDDMTFYNYFADRDPICFTGFSSLSKFLDHVEALPIPDNRNGTHDWYWHQYEDGKNTLTEAIRIARTGWTAGLGITSLIDTPPARAKHRKRSVAGGSVSVGRMLSGNPAHMTTRQRLPKHRNIRLFVETVTARTTKRGTMIMRALLIGAMVDRLENEGYRCEIIATYCAQRRDFEATYQAAIHLKDAGEKLSLIDLVFAFGHPGFNRIMNANHGAVGQCDNNPDDRNYISFAFDDDHRPGENEFYIPQLLPFEQAIIERGNVMEMLKFIEPEGLPITLRER